MSFLLTIRTNSDTNDSLILNLMLCVNLLQNQSLLLGEAPTIIMNHIIIKLMNRTDTTALTSYLAPFIPNQL
ncbi:hypothetical protein, partial [Vibrio anguillarum]|uniref:hypothetical protein n=1 Tax=Vibrio anguillarum TaxID=55601 RepID=UPI001BDFFBF4